MELTYKQWNDPYENENSEENALWVNFDYYQRPFQLFHHELRKLGYRSDFPHPIRKRFWQLLPYRDYLPLEGRVFLLQYIRSVEDELKSLIEKNSVAYWLHLYRRLSPGPIGADKHPHTIGLVRATLEAAIQKYALLKPCDRVGITSDVPVSSVFGGLLLGFVQK
jgi:hypothetical protein